MLIKSKKTGLEHIVDAAGWANLVARGEARKFIILAKDTPEPDQEQVPEDLHTVSYNKLVKQGTKAFKAKEYNEAQKLYLQAAEIKKTSFVSDKLAQIANLLEEEE